MKIMSNHTSARERQQTPHTNESTKNQTISDALKRRAQSVINNKSIDAETRAIIRYGLETNDPWLSELVRRADAGETVIDNMYVPPTSEEKIQALGEIICRAGDEPSAALLILMATLENAPHPKALANTAKHFAFSRCVESNLYGIVDAQIALLEGELLAANSPAA
jgi:hypothetical protein